MPHLGIIDQQAQFAIWENKSFFKVNQGGREVLLDFLGADGFVDFTIYPDKRGAGIHLLSKESISPGGIIRVQEGLWIIISYPLFKAQFLNLLFGNSVGFNMDFGGNAIKISIGWAILGPGIPNSNQEYT